MLTLTSPVRLGATSVSLASVVFLLGRWTAPKAAELGAVPSAVSAAVHPKEVSSLPENASTSSTETENNRNKHSARRDRKITLAKRVTEEGCHLTSEKSFDRLFDDLVEWAKVSPQEALAYIGQRFGSSDRKGEFTTRLLTSLARSNPAAAWDWVLANEGKNAQDVSMILNEIGKTDPAAAWSAAVTYGEQNPADAQNALAGALLGIAYGGDFSQAARCVEQVATSHSPGDYNFASLLVNQWARYAPQDAAAWAETLPPGPARTEALANLAQSWSSVSPAGAADFAVGIADPSERQQTLSAIMGGWLARDPQAASRWVDQYRFNPALDHTLADLSTLPSISNYDDAIAWAKNITDQELETESLTTIYSRWWSNAPDVALASLQSVGSGVPESIRSEILLRIQLRQKGSMPRTVEMPLQ